jgi:hypothetical protein
VRRVLLALSLQEGWGNIGWASDWGKNIYAPTAFLGDANSDPRTFSIRTQFTAPDGSHVDKTWKASLLGGVPWPALCTSCYNLSHGPVSV